MMDMDSQFATKKILPIILKTLKANENDVKPLNSELIEVLNEIGPKALYYIDRRDYENLNSSF